MIVAGFGFRSTAKVESLENAFQKATIGFQVDRFASADDKARSPVFCDFAARFSIPVVQVVASDLTAQITQTISAASLASRQTGSVAEAAALAAAGRGARLIVSRVKSADGGVTCAVAEGEGV